jgi:hypothetical protein
MSAIVAEALHLAAFGWPVFPLEPASKRPLGALVPHGFEDASTDEHAIARWWKRVPDANLGVATGAPGPTVVDVDAPEHMPIGLDQRLVATGAPTVATTRGSHFYFAGTGDTTHALFNGERKYGEIRGVGSYVVAPPSVHPSGKVYVWTNEVNGALPLILEGLVADTSGRGKGDLTLERRISHGERHDFLNDVAIRQVRGGILDEGLIVTVLEAAFAQHCDPYPPPAPNEFRDHAHWALRSRIGQREREAAAEEKETGKKTKVVGPSSDAPLTEHRAFLERLAGTGGVSFEQPKRHGPKLEDPCDLPLSNGQRIHLSRLDQIDRSPRAWAHAVLTATNGMANPIQSLTTSQRTDLLRSICILANAPPISLEDDLTDAVTAFLALTESEVVHLVDGVAKYNLISRHYDRPAWRPDRPVVEIYGTGIERQEVPIKPWLIIDWHENRRYVVSGNLHDYLCWRRVTSSGEYRTALSTLELERMWLYGREASSEEARGPQRRKNQLMLVEIPASWTEEMP